MKKIIANSPVKRRKISVNFFTNSLIQTFTNNPNKIIPQGNLVS